MIKLLRKAFRKDSLEESENYVCGIYKTKEELKTNLVNFE